MFITASKMARTLGVSPGTMLRWLADGSLNLKAYPTGRAGRVRYRLDDFREWIKKAGGKKGALKSLNYGERRYRVAKMTPELLEARRRGGRKAGLKRAEALKKKVDHSTTIITNAPGFKPTNGGSMNMARCSELAFRNGVYNALADSDQEIGRRQEDLDRRIAMIEAELTAKPLDPKMVLHDLDIVRRDIEMLVSTYKRKADNIESWLAEREKTD